MSKRLISIFRGIAVFSVVFSLFIFNGCNKDDEPVPPFTGSIYELISDPQFQEGGSVTSAQALDSLLKYVDLSAAVKALLQNTTVDYTFFAPTNEAFISLLQTPGFPERIEDINPNLIAGVLAYHVVNEELLLSELTPTGAGAGISTNYSHTDACTGALTGQVIKVNDNGSLLTGSTDPAILITSADHQTTDNGILHVVGKVLIPPSVGASLTPILGKHSATVLLGADFTYLAQVMTKADCGVGGVTPLSAMLSSTGPFTVFLPPNAVFEGTAAAQAITVTQLIAAFTPQQWRDIILNHIVAGTNNNAALTNNLVLTTSQNANAKLTITTVTPGAPPAGSPVGKMLATSGGATGLGGTTSCPIYVVDIAVSNGVDHVVGKILFPN